MGSKNVPEGDAAPDPQAPEATITVSKADLQALIAEQVAQQVAALQAGASGADANWIAQLTREIGKLTTQGTGQPEPIEPHILERRKVAKNRMIELLNDALDRAVADPHDRSGVPLYRVLQEVHMDGRLITPFILSEDPKAPKEPTDIFYLGIPNICLFPLNEAAEKIHEQCIIWCGDQKIFGHDPNETYFISRGRGDSLAMRLRESVVVAGSRDGVPGIGLNRMGLVAGVEMMKPAESREAAANIADYMRRMGLKIQRDESVREERVLGTYMNPAQFSEVGTKSARRIDETGRQDIKTYG
jgi:hypothetical protein